MRGWELPCASPARTAAGVRAPVYCLQGIASHRHLPKHLSHPPAHVVYPSTRRLSPCPLPPRPHLHALCCVCADYDFFGACRSSWRIASLSKLSGLLAPCKPELRSVPRSCSARKEFNSTGPPGVWRTAWNIPLALWMSRQSDRQADSWLQLLKVSYVGERKLRTPAAHRIPFQIWVSSDVSESDDGGSQITSNRQIRRRALTLHVKSCAAFVSRRWRRRTTRARAGT